MEKIRILCLDLDGTVRRSKSGKIFIEGPDDIELIPGMKEAIAKYVQQGYLAIGVTNQGGVAHGFKDCRQVATENRVTAELLNTNGMLLASVFFCPYDKNGTVPEFNHRSLHRKPGIGMLCAIEVEMINDEIGFPDWDNSLFVGDRPEDEECAKSAGVPFMWAHDFLKQSI